MNILGIETSCDETAISLLTINKNDDMHSGTVLSHVVHTQIELHKEFGGVFPALAKRDHILNIIPVLTESLKRAHTLTARETKTNDSSKEEIIKLICKSEVGLADQILEFHNSFLIENIDAIAITNGPGLTPALWVGVNTAKCLSILWGIPVIPTNHMHGHLLSPFIHGSNINIPALDHPIMGLLLSGGHTEITLMDSLSSYATIGHTLDDAIGEAFDKTARMIGIPYPGGRELDIRASKQVCDPEVILPRPMLHSKDLNFSFSGLKTAVLYIVRKQPLPLTEEFKDAIAFELHNAIIEVLLKKLTLAIDLHIPHTIVVGGGVIANNHIKKALTEYISKHHSNITLYMPEFTYATDNASMIALAGYITYLERNISVTPDEIYNNPNDSIVAYSRT